MTRFAAGDAQSSFTSLIEQARACRLCDTQLDAGVRSVFQVDPAAKILIAVQAPGSKAHATGIPFNDSSGDRLREWLGVNAEQFYDPTNVAILPMAFCYPGGGKSGDLPPPSVCAATWRQRMLAAMPTLCLTLVIGQYAHAWHLVTQHKNLT